VDHTEDCCPDHAPAAACPSDTSRADRRRELRDSRYLLIADGSHLLHLFPESLDESLNKASIFTFTSTRTAVSGPSGCQIVSTSLSSGPVPYPRPSWAYRMRHFHAIWRRGRRFLGPRRIRCREPSAHHQSKDHSLKRAITRLNRRFFRHKSSRFRASPAEPIETAE